MSGTKAERWERDIENECANCGHPKEDHIGGRCRRSSCNCLEFEEDFDGIE